MVDDTPVEEVLRLMNFGMGDADIIRKLTDEGHSPVEISDALNQAKIKKEITPEGLTPSILSSQPAVEEKMIPSVPKSSVPRPMAVPPMMQQRPQQRTESPEPQAYQSPYAYPTYPQEQQEAPKVDTEAIEEIAEEIVNEKWLEIKGKISDVIEWKTYADKRISSVDERVKRIELSMDRLQAALLSKMQEYGRDVKDLGAEMHSLENAFGKILNPLVENVKELSKITEDLKEKVPKKVAVKK